MNFCELEKLISKIIDLRFTEVGWACDMLTFNFGGKGVDYAIHAQGFTRIIKNDNILVTTLDWQSWDGESEENNDYLCNLKRFKPNIEGGVVLSVEVNSLFDLAIKMDNGVTIQVFVGNGYQRYDDEWEQYRFFEVSFNDEESEPKNLPPHYVVYGKHIEIHD